MQRELTDTLMVSYLYVLRNFTIRPLITNGNKLISFIIEGENLNEAIERFYANEPVPIQDFCQAYKTIRSMIFNLKGERDNGKERTKVSTRF